MTSVKRNVQLAAMVCSMALPVIPVMGHAVMVGFDTRHVLLDDAAFEHTLERALKRVAQDVNDEDIHVVEKPVIDKPHVMRVIQDRYPARVLKVKPVERQGQRYFRVKLLFDDGRIRTVFVDAHNGNIIEKFDS